MLHPFIAFHHFISKCYVTFSHRPYHSPARRHINANKERWKQLNGLDPGIFNGWTMQEIKEKHPQEFEARNNDKLMYRYGNL